MDSILSGIEILSWIDIAKKIIYPGPHNKNIKKTGRITWSKKKYILRRTHAKKDINKTPVMKRHIK